MISTTKQPLNKHPADEDFTLDHYRHLLKIAKKNYILATYKRIPHGRRFLLWRHDVDYSLNRSLSLAELEYQEGVHSTFFLNPNCQFYNLFEKSQFDIVMNILELGHDIGLHLDASFYKINDEAQLSNQLEWQAKFFERLFGVSVVAFSFHNPTSLHLSFEAETYGGIINCYSLSFKTEVGYCSDSNGYWRYRRLSDVLTDATDYSLQVLTHPGWWQKAPMPARKRIFRSVYGRARSVMRQYDDELQKWGRVNQGGLTQALLFFKAIIPDTYELLDFLWNSQRLETLFLELWRLHEIQINRLCKAFLVRDRGLSETAVETIFVDNTKCLDRWRLFQRLLDQHWQEVTSGEESERGNWVSIRDQLIHGCFTGNQQELEDGCVYLCDMIQRIAHSGTSLEIHYDGLSPLGSDSLPKR